ncbi:MAG: flagellar biosynthetic protein FliO [Cellvibrionaceae bacterium]|nr:flagellar biosynthetic protein FliO [Cellvibrionaceae bacterium]
MNTIAYCYKFTTVLALSAATTFSYSENTVALLNTTHYQHNLSQVLFVLLLMVGLILALGWMLKRFGNFSSSNSRYLSVKACLPLSSKEKLLVIQVGDEQLLVAVSPGNIRHLTTLDKPLDEKIDNKKTDRKKANTENFSQTLHQLMTKAVDKETLNK